MSVWKRIENMIEKTILSVFAQEAIYENVVTGVKTHLSVDFNKAFTYQAFVDGIMIPATRPACLIDSSVLAPHTQDRIMIAGVNYEIISVETAGTLLTRCILMEIADD